MYGNRVLRYLLVGGELGTETNIGLLVGSSAMSPQFFAFIGNDDFITNCVLKSWCFRVFANISSRSSRDIKMSWNFNILFLLRMPCCVRVSASKFQVSIRSGSRGKTCRWFIHFLAGPSRGFSCCDMLTPVHDQFPCKGTGAVLM